MSRACISTSSYDSCYIWRPGLDRSLGMKGILIEIALIGGERKAKNTVDEKKDKRSRNDCYSLVAELQFSFPPFAASTMMTSKTE